MLLRVVFAEPFATLVGAGRTAAHKLSHTGRYYFIVCLQGAFAAGAADRLGRAGASVAP